MYRDLIHIIFENKFKFDTEFTLDISDIDVIFGKGALAKCKEALVEKYGWRAEILDDFKFQYRLDGYIADEYLQAAIPWEIPARGSIISQPGFIFMQYIYDSGNLKINAVHKPLT